MYDKCENCRKHGETTCGNDPDCSCFECIADLIDRKTAVPAWLEALKLAAELIKTARKYFPKSIKNGDKFQLENTCAALNKAIYAAESEMP